ATSLLDANATIQYGPQISANWAASLAYECGAGMGPLPPLISFHGDADQRVNPKNADFLFEQWALTADWADDGELNGSVSLKDTAQKEITNPGGLNYSEKTLSTQSGWQIKQVIVHGMAHAWSGGR